MMEPSQELVAGLWARLRNVLIALDRLDRLETGGEFLGWVEAFQCDEAQTRTAARQWVLRAIRLASDPLDYRILSLLHESAGMTVTQLMEATALGRVDLTERIKELAAVGLVAQALDADTVQGTRAGEGMVAWVESLGEQLAGQIRAGVTKDNPPPKPHLPRFTM